MWQASYEKTFAGVQKEDIWAAWSDIPNWNQWDVDLEYTKLTEPFSQGARFILKPKGGPKVDIEITRMEPLVGFTDVAKFPLAKMYDIHDLEDTPQGLKIKSTIRVEGPLAWLWKKLVAQDVAAGVPKQMESLVQYAKRNKGRS